MVNDGNDREFSERIEKMKRMRKAFIALALGLMTITMSGCSSCERAMVDIKSDMGGGLERVVNIYTANGDLLAQYTGKIDLEMTEGGYLKFDLDGKRYVYYNCFVETIADID